MEECHVLVRALSLLPSSPPTKSWWQVGLWDPILSCQHLSLWLCGCDDSKDQKTQSPLAEASFQKDVEAENNFSVKET